MKLGRRGLLGMFAAAPVAGPSIVEGAMAAPVGNVVGGLGLAGRQWTQDQHNVFERVTRSYRRRPGVAWVRSQGTEVRVEFASLRLPLHTRIRMSREAEARDKSEYRRMLEIVAPWDALPDWVRDPLE